jgi:glyoxylase-like metal-dependent hydrolase (beta-lactamase superfamily II)
VEVPPVEEVRPGIWALPIPMPGSLGYVCAYTVESPDGILLIDAGWDSPEAFAALEQGLITAGSGLGEVKGVLFTHGHHDHYGLAQKVRAATNAWLALHEADAASVVQRSRIRVELSERVHGLLDDLRIRADEQEEVSRVLTRQIGPEEQPPQPDRFVFDGEEVKLRSGELIAIHTPGHSRGHICFVHRSAGVVFTGDHVLSRTTPHIGAYFGSAESPLDDYLVSLRRLRPFGEMMTLPGHEQRVLLGPRIDELLAHHEERLIEVREAMAAGAESAVAIAQRMTWAGPWDRYQALDKFLATTEALAHLFLLRRRGEVTCSETRPFNWHASRVPPFSELEAAET